MRPLVAALIAATALAIPAAAAAEAKQPPLGPRVAKLERAVASLRAENRSLRAALTRNSHFDRCRFVLSVDAVIIAYRAIDIIFSAFINRTLFSSVTPLDDAGSCAAVGVNRTPPTLAYVPSASALRAFGTRLGSSLAR